MGVIRVKNIKLYANHGCMVEEGKIGSDYIVNVKLKTNLDASILSSKLIKSINFEGSVGVGQDNVIPSSNASINSMARYSFST